MSRLRTSIPKDPNNPHSVRFKQLSFSFINLAIKNNRTLLKRKGMTLAAQAKEYEAKGLYFSLNTLKSYIKFDLRTFHDVKMGYLIMLADYWGKTLWEFISVDYSLEDKKQDVVTGASPQDDKLNEFI